MTLEWMSSPDASYGLVLAAVACAVAYRRRRQFARSIDPAGPIAWPAAVIALGAATFLVGLLGADVFLTRVSLVVLLTGIVWLLAGGPALRVLAAPFVFLAIAIPPPTLL